MSRSVERLVPARVGLLAPVLVIVQGMTSPAPAYASQPSVTMTRPANGQTGVPRDAFASADVFVPNGGIDPATLTSETVSLHRTSDGQPVPAILNTSGGGDVIVLRPVSLLDAETSYTFVVTSGLQDVAGETFASFTMSFTTGTTTGGTDTSIAFEKVALTTPANTAFTCLTIGPDGKLYGAVINGEILRFPIRLDGTIGPSESITSLQAANGGNRLLIGLRFDPAAMADNLILWASHSSFAFDGAADWEGKITRLSGPSLGTVTDFVVHLPRSARDHVTNQIDFGPDGALYFPQGSNTAMGAPDAAWELRPERLLTGALLRLDTAAVMSPPLDAKTEEGGAFDPSAPGSPLTLFSTGMRNAYDLVWHSNGSLYVPTNGSASGGTTPASPDPVFCGNRIDQPIHGDYTGPVVPGIDYVAEPQSDYLFRAVNRGYYGHPNPVRCEWVMNGGNPTLGQDVAEVDQYPVRTQPDRNWRGAVFDFGFNQSPDGILESRSGAFEGSLTGKLLVARFSGGDDIIVLTPGIQGEIIASQTGVSGFGGFNNPLDLAEEPSTGFLYISEYGEHITGQGAKLTLLRPILGPCTGAAPPERPDLRVTRVPPAGGARLSWSTVAAATDYDVVRGSLEILRASGGNFTAALDRCLGNRLVATSREDPSAPAAGTGFWYLVRAVNCASSGTYDSAGPGQVAPRDAEIQAAAATCP